MTQKIGEIGFGEHKEVSPPETGAFSFKIGPCQEKKKRVLFIVVVVVLGTCKGSCVGQALSG